ncbi:MAG: RNA methyltransferase [Betaproteobacteria bacterium]|nr:RNA methyltransferase [Betaproteobacteria bacterium]
MNAPGPLANVRVVLSRPSHPGNIGAAARAMKTMGLDSLYLVNPRRFPDAEADARASGAIDVLARARVHASLDEALAGTVLAAALTSRSRDLPHPIMDARAAAAELLRYAANHPVALVFGSETAGLTIEEASRCQLLVHVPANPEYASLNLAAAVQVMAYELRVAASEPGGLRALEYEPAEFEDVELFFEHLERVMVKTGFLDPQQPKRLMQRLRRLFARTRLEKEEVNILRGILRALENS